MIRAVGQLNIGGRHSNTIAEDGFAMVAGMGVTGKGRVELCDTVVWHDGAIGQDSLRRRERRGGGVGFSHVRFIAPALPFAGNLSAFDVPHQRSLNHKSTTDPSGHAIGNSVYERQMEAAGGINEIYNFYVGATLQNNANAANANFNGTLNKAQNTDYTNITAINGISYVSQATANYYINQGASAAYAVGAVYGCTPGTLTNMAVNSFAANVNTAKNTVNAQITVVKDNKKEQYTAYQAELARQAALKAAQEAEKHRAQINGLIARWVAGMREKGNTNSQNSYLPSSVIKFLNGLIGGLNSVATGSLSFLPIGGLGLFLSSYVRKQNAAYNKNQLTNPTGIVNGQGNGEYVNMKYGLTNVVESGCGVIAVHNALLLLGESSDLNKQFSYFEKNGMLLYGKLGTNPLTAVSYFEEKGFTTNVTTKVSDFDRLASNSDVSLLTYFNSNPVDLSEGAHTVAITKTANGRIEIYNFSNLKTNSNTDYNTIEEMLRNGYYTPIVMIGIER